MVQNMCMNLPGEGLRDIDSSESLVYFVVICIFYFILKQNSISVCLLNGINKYDWHSNDYGSYHYA